MGVTIRSVPIGVSFKKQVVLGNLASHSVVYAKSLHSVDVGSRRRRFIDKRVMEGISPQNIPVAKYPRVIRNVREVVILNHHLVTLNLDTDSPVRRWSDIRDRV